MQCKRCKETMDKGFESPSAGLVCEGCRWDILDELHAQGDHERATLVQACDCGRQVWCDGFTNTCECGADYNSSGQLLAPREQWGEETGEHWTDCVKGEL